MHNEKLHKLNDLPNITIAIKSIRMWWVRYVAWMGCEMHKKFGW